MKFDKKTILTALFAFIIGAVTIGLLDANRPRPLFSSASGEPCYHSTYSGNVGAAFQSSGCNTMFYMCDEISRAISLSSGQSQAAFQQLYDNWVCTDVLYGEL